MLIDKLYNKLKSLKGDPFNITEYVNYFAQGFILMQDKV